MQRKVSLVVADLPNEHSHSFNRDQTEQEHNEHNEHHEHHEYNDHNEHNERNEESKNSPLTPKFNKLAIPRRFPNINENSNYHPLATLDEKSLENIASSQMAHVMSMRSPCEEEIAICHEQPTTYCYLQNQKVSSPKISSQNQTKEFLDDLELNANVHSSMKKKGSVPMIGSLVYYKSKSADDTNFPTDHENNFNELIERRVPLPHEKLDSLNNYSFTKQDNQSDQKQNSPPNTEDNETVLLSSDNESIYSSESPLDNLQQLPNLKAYRHFSYPWVLDSNSTTTNNRDDFGLLDSKIHSKIKQNEEKLRKSLKKEKKQEHFSNTHYHIPGVDPEPSPSTSSNVSEAQTPTSIYAQSRSSSTSKLNPTSTKYDRNLSYGSTVASRHREKPYSIPCTAPENPSGGHEEIADNSHNRNNRHRRRLTCAMIFTRPKVVEI